MLSWPWFGVCSSHTTFKYVNRLKGRSMRKKEVKFRIEFEFEFMSLVLLPSFLMNYLCVVDRLTNNSKEKHWDLSWCVPFSLSNYEPVGQGGYCSLLTQGYVVLCSSVTTSCKYGNRLTINSNVKEAGIKQFHQMYI